MPKMKGRKGREKRLETLRGIEGGRGEQNVITRVQRPYTGA